VTVTPLPLSVKPAAGRSKLKQHERARDAGLADRNETKGVLAQIEINLGAARDAELVARRRLKDTSIAMATSPNDAKARADFQAATADLAAATTAADALEKDVLPEVRARLAEKEQALQKAEDAITSERHRLAVGERIAAARELVAASQALMAAIKRWEQTGNAARAICPGRGPSGERWRAIYAMPWELEEIFRNFPHVIKANPDSFVRNEIAAWGVGDPTADEPDTAA
jgi:hypothetical protein